MSKALAFQALPHCYGISLKPGVWVQGRQRTVECCHYCFQEAGSFHPDNVDILSKVLWNHSCGKSFCFLSDYLCNSSCEVSFSSHSTLSPLSQLPFAFDFTLHACIQLDIFSQVPSCCYGLPYPLHLECRDHYSFDLPALKSKICLAFTSVPGPNHALITGFSSLSFLVSIDFLAAESHDRSPRQLRTAFIRDNSLFW